MNTPDGRTATEHDTDRILYSDALRRLGGVTQVVAVGEMPLFHTRLTHTLKVQQLARRIAEHLVRDHRNDAIREEIGGIDVGACEAAGLAHDLGHAPFGHVGETALDAKCRDGGLDGFEGNAQTFRILTKLARRGGANSFGLGLSDVTLRAVIKYPWLRTGEHESDSKWNAYPTEAAAFEQARRGCPAGSPSVEASIMDVADDITYAVHDLEDFIRANRVPIVTLATDNLEMVRFTSRAVGRLKSRKTDIDWDEAVSQFVTVLQAMFAQFRIHTGSVEDLATLQDASRFLINQYVGAITLQAGEKPVALPPSTVGEVELWKQLPWHYVIHEPALATLQQGHVKVVEGLFDELVTWLDKADVDKVLYRLPTRLQDLYSITLTEPGSEAYANKEARRARAVADYIASLTEGQAIDLHERLAGAGVHSVLDPWLAY